MSEVAYRPQYRQIEQALRERITGLRPGEKLHEELWGEGERVVETPHPKIRRVSGPVVDAGWLEDELAELERLVEAGETLEAVSRLAAMSRDPRYAVVRDQDSVLEDTLH